MIGEGDASHAEWEDALSGRQREDSPPSPDAEGVQDVVIVGAGAAGLAMAACLRREGVDALVLEAGEGPGETWRRLYERLHLHTVKALSGMPGMPMPASYPRYPAREQVVAYLDDYARRNAVRIVPGTRVLAVARDAATGLWTLRTSRGAYRARVLVAASGVFANPQPVSFPRAEEFGGEIVPAHLYKTGAPYVGRKVLVVGVGNTGAEIAVDLMEHGAHVAVAIRSGANVVPRELLGVPIQRWAHVVARLPRGVVSRVSPVLLRRAELRQRRAGIPRAAYGVLDGVTIPVIGLDLLNAATAGKIAIVPGVARFTREGVVLADGREWPADVVLLATGYHPALGYLAGIVSLDEHGKPAVDEHFRSAEAPGLYCVGLNYGVLGTLYNIAREAPVAAASIAREVRAPVPRT